MTNLDKAFKCLLNSLSWLKTKWRLHSKLKTSTNSDSYRQPRPKSKWAFKRPNSNLTWPFTNKNQLILNLPKFCLNILLNLTMRTAQFKLNNPPFPVPESNIEWLDIRTLDPDLPTYIMTLKICRQYLSNPTKTINLTL